MIQQFHSWVYMQKTKNSNSIIYMNLIAHSIIIYNSKDMKTTQMPINR